ncbi:MAG: HAD hydrolase-like protein [Candidatus Micrarchaeota archaeon]|nr:HAD hydrolase-like protein [Candidatus Micrarchaeota archaeon]
MWIKDKVNMKDINCIVFDIDRTLIDIRKSYEDAIRLAVSDMLKMAKIEINPSDVMSEDDIYRLWWKVQLADVWYITYAGTLYYLTKVLLSNRNASVENLGESGTEGSFSKEISTLRAFGKNLSEKTMTADFDGFVDFLLKAEGEKYIDVIKNALSAKFPEFDAIEKKLDILWSKKLAQMLFQAEYQGNGWYREENNAEPPVNAEKGLWQNDRLFSMKISERDALYTLSKKFPLGIATARPASEAKKGLEVTGIAEFFKKENISTLEDGSKAERIMKSLKSLGCEGGKSIYIGDGVSDGLSVASLKKKGVNILFAGVVVPGSAELMKEQERRLKDAGADIIVNNISELLEVFE